MADDQDITVEKNGSHHIVHDKKSGRSFKLKGYGALKGQIAFNPDIDLTKPIAAQVTRMEDASAARAEFNREPGARLASLDHGEAVDPATVLGRIQRKSRERRTSPR
jgi:hypothetical protein